MTTKITEIIEDNRGLYDETLPIRALHQQGQILVQRGIIYLLIGALMVVAFYMAIAKLGNGQSDIDRCLSNNQSGGNIEHVWTIDGCRAYEIEKANE